jgi:acetylglutamate synthase
MAHITVYGPREIDQIDEQKFEEVIRSAFSKSLTEGYLKQDISHIIVAGDYGGVAALMPFMDWLYLDKFAVDKRYQGNGVGSSLMKKALQLSHDYGLFWRTSAAREDSVRWYLKHVPHAKHKSILPWEIFWAGKRHPSQAIHYALNKKETIK